MVSMVTLGVSFLIFFVVLGFMWTVGVYILAELFEAMPVVSPAWASTSNEVQENLKTIMIWVPPILLLFASIKMLSNAASRSAD